MRTNPTKFKMEGVAPVATESYMVNNGTNKSNLQVINNI